MPTLYTIMPVKQKNNHIKVCTPISIINLRLWFYWPCAKTWVIQPTKTFFFCVLKIVWIGVPYFFSEKISNLQLLLLTSTKKQATGCLIKTLYFGNIQVVGSIKTKKKTQFNASSSVIFICFCNDSPCKSNKGTRSNHHKQNNSDQCQG